MKDQRKGIIYAVAACALWGTSFVAPIMLKGFGVWAVVGGRYLTWGVIALASLWVLRHLRNTPAAVWRSALGLSMLGNALYYVLLTASLQWAGAFAPSVIIGTLPITLALAGRALDREHAQRPVKIGAPLALIGLGLLLVNYAEWQVHSATAATDATSASSLYWWGIAAAVGAHLAWLVFGLRNARYLKAHPELNAGQWSNLLGAALLPAAVAMLIAGWYRLPATLPASWAFYLTVVVLTGVLSGWAAALLWSRASRLLPVSLAAQLIVIETLSSMALASLWLRTVPSSLTLLGAASLVAGVVVALRRFSAG
jgi:drug/metabolite transporter (DMT)-like permease